MIEAGGTSFAQLIGIVERSKPYFLPLPGFHRTTQAFDRFSTGLDVDEVYPDLFVGNSHAALNKQYLQLIGITHVLNAAEGTSEGMVNTNSTFYCETGMQYLGLPLVDIPSANIHFYFDESANFIEHGIKSGGKVLVHCYKGRSRSCTIAVAYLMLKCKMTAPMALRLCCLRHKVQPNCGFLQRLVDLDNSLFQNTV